MDEAPSNSLEPNDEGEMFKDIVCQATMELSRRTRPARSTNSDEHTRQSAAIDTHFRQGTR